MTLWEVEVRPKPEQPDREAARINVRDRGRGVAPELLESLGKPVIHADRSGLGIGLMLSQASVERHGGSIELRNLREGGALATLTLPLATGPGE